jgi:short-subunit dehydrogenase
MKELRGKVVIVTGASRGIGPYIARALAAQGANVALLARSEALLNEVAGTLNPAARSGVFPVDLARDKARRQVLAAVESEMGPVDVLVNNAVVESTTPYEETTFEEIESQVTVNLVAPMMLVRYLLPGMLERGSGHIVNLSSLAGKVAMPYQGPYSATKAALVNWTQSLRLEFRDRGVSASAVCPGFVEAGMYERAKESGARAPGIVGTSSPEAVARAVVRAILEDRAELLVNPGMPRLLVTLAEASPGLRERLMKRGVSQFSRTWAGREEPGTPS